MNGVGIILLEKLRPEKEEIEKHGISDQFGNFEKGFIFQLDIGNFPDDLKNENDNGRA